jgi:hypothetical protein
VNHSNGLRTAGTLVFVLAAILYLIEGWTDPHVALRAGLLASLSVSLSALAIVAIRRWHDAQGARLFLALSAATLPAHQAQLGAGIWELTRGSGSVSGVLIAGAATVTALPLLALGLSALVRRRGMLLATLLFACGCPLVLPTRDPDTIATLAAVQLAALLVLELRVWRRDALMQSTEAYAARALLVCPAAILLGRNAFYATTEAWLAACLALPSVCLLAVGVYRPKLRRLLEGAGAAGLLVALCWALPLRPALGVWISAAALGLNHTLQLRARWLDGAALAALALGAVAGLSTPDALLTILLVPTGCWLARAAYVERSRALLLSAIAVTSVGLVAQLTTRVRWPEHHLWLPAAVLGVGLIAGASVIENYRRSAPRWLRKLRSHFEGSC